MWWFLNGREMTCFCVLSPVQALGGCERRVLGFVFVLKSRNVKRKNISSYFLVKSQLLRTNTLDCTTVQCSCSRLLVAVGCTWQQRSKGTYG